MGFSYYTLPDGREAGYAVEATCDFPGCTADIDRGLDYLCGDMPDGWRDPEDYGCGGYFCYDHTYAHDGDCGHDSADIDVPASEVESFVERLVRLQLERRVTPHDPTPVTVTGNGPIREMRA